MGFCHIKKIHDQRGFTLLETILGIAIFVLVGLAVFSAYGNLQRLVRVSSERTAANSILQEEMESIHAIPFTNLGLRDSVPAGALEPLKTVVRNNQSYEVRTIIRNIDDPFDGIIGNRLDDVRFSFSAQVGDGGLTMTNTAIVYGRIFSNGNVTGDNSAQVTQDAWVANANTLNTLTVGGDAHAHTIQNATISGSAYYQVILNSTVNGTLYPQSPDSPSQTLPITDAQITTWKNEAEAVATTGPVTLGTGQQLTLGPAKIIGDLTLTGNAELKVKGTLWVTGSILLLNTASIYLDPSYSSASGVVIADGTISIDNNTAACGSEGYNSAKNECNPFAGSYSLFISMNSSTDVNNPAIKIKNSTGFRGILYTNTGLISIENGAEVVEATGYAVRLYNHSSISYGTGIFNLLITGNPSVGDTSPADYKLAEVRVTCTSCEFQTSFKATTTIAPKRLETTGGNGALLIQVYNAVGQPVSDASVTIVNTTTTPLINFTDTTDAQGRLTVVDAPPAEQSYEITVTKQNYSTDRTYAIGYPANPSPLKPHLTVIADAVTQASFAIDELSTLNISTVSPVCSPLGSVTFTLTGAKLIGQSPDVPKYSQNKQTNSQGTLSLSDMEWDTYGVSITDSRYYLGGSLPSLPVEVSPNTTEALSMVLEPRTTNALLVKVIDAVSQQPVQDASVKIDGPGYTKTLQTGEGYWQQTNWSGGGGQSDWSDTTRFFESSSVGYDNPAGELKLQWNGSQYAASGSLTSSIFDNGAPTNFYHLVVRPEGQPVQTGTDPVRIQIASSLTNTATTTWTFVGPDGTTNTYYTPNNNTLSSAHNDDRYIRYRIQLFTADTAYTPNVSDTAISFADACTPSGQVYFNDVVTGSNTVTVSKAGYITSVQPATLIAGWQTITISLTPN
ncbi:MAG: hypothetical protein A2677_02690 [Candidatus Komeilibacteria bacterium RIFCSPHIGHO2_01_FULL_52_14]|uniref:Uncharacterized protein n=1 Tax=Candidatus Komeilibacteria bacterium RIFCSPHIGHO2_01_FULL_52_14 TaxID=1798549 RepID=A0A1G2BI90_9BACT|nr:MAG: hypothetical protein A2677_02690 [Candidatus Komeilibacteria bacterium RIFCSPHIGHO2_01_FULL_52_14]